MNVALKIFFPLFGVEKRRSILDAMRDACVLIDHFLHP
jgi:hypothetical protein